MAQRNKGRCKTPGAIHFVDPICVECGGQGRMTSGAKVYPNHPDRHGKMFFACACGAFVTCHPGTAIPTGRPASASTRYLRSEAHKAFDPIWLGNRTRGLATGYARKRAYRWLAAQMGLEAEACHIGHFNAEQCRRVIEICNQFTAKRAA